MLAAEDGDPPEPRDYAEAMRDPHSKMWRLASDEEIMSLDKNETWIVMERLKDRKVIGCRWIYKRKPGIPGVEEPRFKGRVVAKGYVQKEGMDYNEIFSPVVKHVSIHFVMAIVVNEDMELGLKQSPCQWNQKFNTYMLEIGFKRSDYDQCVYVKYTQGIYIYLLLYVDDMLVACKNMKLIKDLSSS